jgi:hypothetical protein
MKKVLHMCVGAALAAAWAAAVQMLLARGYLPAVAEVPATAAGAALLLTAAFYA